MRLGILGGTGIEGKGLALRFASAGVSVVIGSRSADRARAAADEYNRMLGKELIEGCSNPDMLAVTELVLLAVPFETALAAIESCRNALRPRHVLVDVTVPIRFVASRPEFVQLQAGSNSELIAGHVPEDVAVTAAFKTIPAHVLADVRTDLACDVFVCGDSATAKEQVMDVAARIPQLRPLDAGPLAMAATLERMTFLALHLNRRYKRRGARFSVQGI